MNEQFSRTEALIGKDNLNKLKNSRVAVFGIGGVGGYAVEALVRSGIGHIDIIDNDKIDISNINRQIIATHNTVGQYKVEAAQNRIFEINPECTVKKHKIFYSGETEHLIDLKTYDYIIDAIDSVTSKILLICNAKAKNIPIISSMGTGNKLEAARLEVCDIYKTSVCPLAKVMRYELKKRGIKSLKVVYSMEEPLKPMHENPRIPASVPFVPAAAGMLLAGEVIKDLIENERKS